ncbi:MAG: hypothetical protein CMH57_00335 [Myxococcales bacterium]|nr:hypothetical protein [Myxococcales bacterium]
MSEPTPSHGASADATWLERLVKPWMWRWASYLFALYIFTLIAVYMAVAGRSVSFSYTISGQRAVAASEPIAWRVGVRDLAQGRFLPGATVRVSHRDKGVLYAGRTSPAGFADVNMTLPALQEGPGSLVVTVEPRGESPAEVEVPIEVGRSHPPDLVEAWARASEQLREDREAMRGAPPLKTDSGEELPRVGRGPIAIELLADGHDTTDGLRSTVFVQTTERETGLPVPATVTIKLVKGVIEGDVPRQVQTNGGGLASFALVPIGVQRWRLEVAPREEGGEPSVREVILTSKKKQYAMRLKSPLWKATDELKVPVLTLHRTGALYSDLVMDERVVFGDVSGIGNGGGGFIFKPGAPPRPESGVWLLKLQVYGHALAPGEAVDVRYLALPAPGLEGREALQVVLERAWGAGVRPETASALLKSTWLRTAPTQEVHEQLAFWLATLPHDATHPILQIDTRDRDRVALATEKESWRGPITGLLIASGVVAALIILYLVVFNLLRVRRRSQQMLADLHAELEEEGEQGLDQIFAPGGNLARTQALFQLIFIFATIALFFASIIILLQHL